MKSQALHFHPVILRNLQSFFKNEEVPAFFSGDWYDFLKIYSSSAIFPWGEKDPAAGYQPARLYVVVTQHQGGQLKRLLGSPWRLDAYKPQVPSLKQNTLFNFLLYKGVENFLKAQMLHLRSGSGAHVCPILLPEQSFLGVEFGPKSIDVYFQLHLGADMAVVSEDPEGAYLEWETPPQEAPIYWAQHLKNDLNVRFGHEGLLERYLVPARNEVRARA